MRRRDFCLALAPAASAKLLQGANLPRPAPELMIRMSNNRPPLLLSSFKGKVIAVEFLLTYCSHCQKASRATEIIYRQFGSKGFQPVGAAIDPTGDPEAYMRDQGLSFPVGKVAHDVCLQFMQHSMMQRLLMPQVAFIDRNFQIVEQYAGDSFFFGDKEEKHMRELVERLLKPASAVPASKGKKSVSKKTA
jgi:thiol-disulfide isomerase/thioredoxin